MGNLNLAYINERRLALDISLQDMATALGFKNASTYMKYEKGEYTFRANHVPVLAKKLDCTISELFSAENFADLAKSEKEDREAI